jgi:hypothetical protein
MVIIRRWVMDKDYWFNLSMALFVIIIIGLMIRDYGEYLK